MIGADTALNWGYRTLRSDLYAFPLSQRDCAGGLCSSKSLYFLGHHSGNLGTALGPSGCDLPETQGDDALGLVTKSHRAEPRLPEEHPRSLCVSLTGVVTRSPGVM